MVRLMNEEEISILIESLRVNALRNLSKNKSKNEIFGEKILASLELAEHLSFKVTPWDKDSSHHNELFKLFIKYD